MISVKSFKLSSGQECNDSARTMERMEELLILSQQLDFRWRDQQHHKDYQQYYYQNHTINSITIDLYFEGFFQKVEIPQTFFREFFRAQFEYGGNNRVDFDGDCSRQLIMITKSAEFMANRFVCTKI